MKTQTINQTVMRNYKIISNMIKESALTLDSFWKTSYKNGRVRGSVNGCGEINRNFMTAVVHSNWVDVTRKPFFFSRERALKKINKVLEGIINNFGDNKIVTKMDTTPF